MNSSYNIRSVAILILNEILIKNHSRDQVFEKYFSSENILETDKNLIFNIVLNTLRFKEVFDEIISNLLNIKLQKIEPLIKIAIEIALAQILTMNKIPIYAAISESVEGYKRISKNTRGTGFLNFALRKIIKEHNIKSLFEKYKNKNFLIEHLTNELREELTEEELQTLYRNSFDLPFIFLRINSKYNIKTDILPELEKENIEYNLSEIVPYSIILTKNISTTHLREILPDDSFVIQSELSQLTAYLLNCNKGDRMLDVCCGSQMKSQQIGEILENQIDITSIDIKGIKNPRFNFIKADAQTIRLNNRFNKILIDAPCSGLGTLSQNPEIKFKINKSAIKRFADIQYRILKNISQYLEPEGNLLYSVCTMTKSETTELIKKFLEENKQFEIIRPVVKSDKLDRFITEEGFVKIFNYNKQSFFYVILKRK